MDCQSVQCKLEAAVDVGRLPELTELEHQHTQECEHCRTVALLVQAGLPPVVEGAPGSSAPLPVPVSEAEAPEGLAEAVMARVGSSEASGRGAEFSSAASTGEPLDQRRDRAASGRVLGALKVFVPLAAAAALILTFMPPQVSSIRTTESPASGTRSKRGPVSDQNGFLAPAGKKAVLSEDAAPAAAPRQVAADRLRERKKQSSSGEAPEEVEPSDDGVDRDEVGGKAYQYGEQTKKGATSSFGIAGLRKGVRAERPEEELLATSHDGPPGGAFSEKQEETFKGAKRPTTEADESKPEASVLASLAKEQEEPRPSPEPSLRGNGGAGARSAPSGPEATKYHDAAEEDAEEARDVGPGSQAPLVNAPQPREDGGLGNDLALNSVAATGAPTLEDGERALEGAPAKTRVRLGREPEKKEQKSKPDADVGRRLADALSPVEETAAPSSGVGGTISAVAKPSARAGRAESETESEPSREKQAGEGGEAETVEVARGLARGGRADRAKDRSMTVDELKEAPEPLGSLRSALGALVRRYYPRADVELDGNVIRFAFRAEKDNLARFSKTAEAKQKLATEIAPARGGIVGQMVFQRGRYSGAADNPQAVEGKASTTLFETASTKSLNGHFLVRLAYPPDVSQEFLKEFRKFLKDLDHHLGK